MTADTAFDRLNTRDWNVTLHGESFFYLFNKSVVRNCLNQRVPSEYCLCENKQTDRTEEKQALANSEVVKHNASSACATLTLDPTLAVDLLDIDAIYYRVTYTTVPGKGRFWADLRVHHEDNEGGTEQFDLQDRKIARLDSYEEQSKCIRTHSVRPYCFCRDLA
ncbi:hypothetical protein AAVH_29393 [Aphelenchoides avenae]|nr:hypothetical protein AAVH_29393 [Aphelenchus avenae]